jgi:hypothetical protein
MDPITFAITAINGLRLLLNNPALGGGSSVRPSEASELLGILGTLLVEGDDAHSDLVAFTEQIEAMVVAGRGPTPDEWTALRERSDAAHDRLQEIEEELRDEEEAPTSEPVVEVEEETSEEESEDDDTATGAPV